MAFVKKEFFHIFRDVRTLMILIAMPVILITIFGFALSVEIKNVEVAILAPRYDSMIDKLVDKIDASDYFTVKKRVSSHEEIDALMKRGEIDMALCFDDDFMGQLMGVDGAQLAVLIDGSDPNKASSEAMYITSLIKGGLLENMPQAASLSAGAIVPNVTMLYNPTLKSSYNFVPGVLGLVLMLICALMTSVSIVREKETGTMEVILVSPLRHNMIIFSKILPYFVVSCFILIIIFTLSFTVLGVPLAGSFFWLVVISVLYVILSLSIGIFISTVVSTQLAASLMTGMVFMLPVFMLSGMIFPLESMPDFFQIVSNIVPAKWYIIAVKKVMIEGLGVKYILKEFLILIGMTLIVLFAALKKFKHRLD